MTPRDPAAMLERLQSVTAAYSRALSPAEVARVAVHQGLEALGAASSAIAFPSADGKRLELVDHEGMNEEAVSRFVSVPLEASVASCDSFKSDRAIFLEDRTAYAAGYPLIAPVSAFTDGSKASLPLSVDGRVLGVLGFAFRVWRAFDDRERAFMLALASVTAQALERARLFADTQRALRDAEAANTLKDDFLATVSHELRTPLNAILGWTAMLRTPALDEAGAARALEIVDRNARALTRLVGDVLDVSSIIRGRLRIEHRRVDVAQLVRAVIEATGPAAATKDLTMETVLADDAGEIEGDPDRLQQVVWNLVSNAVKFTPRGGRVRVELTRDRDVVSIVVSDTGIGIAPEFVGHVFERFRQYDSSTTRRHGGLGLGLAIARDLVELHGGSLLVSSAGLGKGATFTVELLGARRGGAEARSTASASGSQVPPGVLTGVHVLVADDASDSRDLIRRVLESAGARVASVASAREALRAYQAARPDVMVADIGMPGEDGYALMRWIRAHETAGALHVRAVALTGYATNDDRDAALAAGYEVHLPKPASPAELVRVVAELAGVTS